MNRFDEPSRYADRMEYIGDTPWLQKVLAISSKASTWLVVIVYGALLGHSFMMRDYMLVPQVVIPLAGFVVLSIFRAAVNKPRPYELYGVGPGIPKDTKGKSFPSRHVYSATVIGMTLMFGSDFLQAGILMIIVMLVIAYVRVYSGVHFVKDVVVGAAFGVIVGLAFFLPIPWWGIPLFF